MRNYDAHEHIIIRLRFIAVRSLMMVKRRWSVPWFQRERESVDFLLQSRFSELISSLLESEECRRQDSSQHVTNVLSGFL